MRGKVIALGRAGRGLPDGSWRHLVERVAERMAAATSGEGMTVRVPAGVPLWRAHDALAHGLRRRGIRARIGYMQPEHSLVVWPREP